MGERLTIRQTPIQGVSVIETIAVKDHRGSFARLFCADDLVTVLGERRIVQINHSQTREVGAVRGMHFQHSPHAEMKMVRCLRGRVFDVALDLRKNSPTFLQWHAEELDPYTTRMLVIPEGCAHGFQVLQEESEMLYLHTQFYQPESEAGLRPTDPALDIKWPLPLKDLSDKDNSHPLILSTYTGVSL